MLSDLQTRKLTRYFEVYDVDDDGRVQQSDFERILENIRVLHGQGDGSPAYRSLREAYLARWGALRAAADGDGDGGVDLDEWLGYWAGALSDDARYEAEAEAIADRLFAVFDLDEDGRIGAGEFEGFYGVFGLAVELARTVFEALDADGDGAITRDELLDLSREFYRGSDAGAAGNLLFGPFEP